MPTTLTPATPAEIITALLGGRSLRYLRHSIGKLSDQDYRQLSCTLCCMRNEATADGPERASEIDRFLAGDGAGSPPDKCRIYTRSSWCPLIDAALPGRTSSTTKGSRPSSAPSSAAAEGGTCA
jgi:hypothetical protein